MSVKILEVFFLRGEDFLEISFFESVDARLGLIFPRFECEGMDREQKAPLLAFIRPSLDMHRFQRDNDFHL